VTTALFLAAAAAAALGQAGCTTLSEWVHNGFKVGPEYAAPPAPLPPGWIDEHDKRVRHGDPNLCSWWDVFDDPVLTALLHESYANNLTVRAAGQQILEAQIARNIARSELLPQAQTAVLGYQRNVVSETGGTPIGPGPSYGTVLNPTAVLPPLLTPSTPLAGQTITPGTGATNSTTNPLVNATASPTGGGSSNSRWFNNISTNLNASWELDFWGLFRRNLEASSANLDQSVNNYDELVVLLLANVATQYVEIRTLQRRLELARKNVALQEPLVAAYEKRYKAGIANSLPGFYQLLSNLENTKALIPVLEILLRQANNQLCILLGQPVHDLLPKLGDGTAADPKDPKRRSVRIPQPRDLSVVVAIPGEYLLRRPDVRAAEDQLRVQTAEIGIAEAEIYPHIGVNGTIGLASNRFGSLFEGRSLTGSIGPSLTWNILNYGRLLANVRLQSVLFRQYVAQYQQALLNANADAENALVAYLQSIEQADHLQRSADAAVNVTGYVIRQYREGFLPPGAQDTGAFINQLFTVINFQVAQQDAAAQAAGNIALNLILVYRAMGGGWQIRKEKDGGHGEAGDGHDGHPHTMDPAPTVAPAPQAKPPEELPQPRPAPAKPRADAAAAPATKSSLRIVGYVLAPAPTPAAGPPAAPAGR
jgi:NodT family efflux transporter outer membrane factor (OMF) lipoprotein